jgi:hypothetical protein
MLSPKYYKSLGKKKKKKKAGIKKEKLGQSGHLSHGIGSYD